MYRIVSLDADAVNDFCGEGQQGVGLSQWCAHADVLSTVFPAIFLTV